MSAELETGYFKGKGEAKLFYRSWVTEAKPPRATLIFCHGFGEHSDRYRFPVDYLSKNYSCYLMDLRGHGYSEGQRAYADSLEDFTEDLRCFVKFVEKKAPGKRFLIGHSFGAQAVLNLVASSSEGIAGIILSSPYLKLALPVPAWKRLTARTLSAIAPRVALGNELAPENLTHDPAVIEAWHADRQILKKITLRLGHLMLENQEELMTLAPRVGLPILFMHGGDDPICSPEGTREFFQATASRDKTLKIYKGMFHEIFNEIEREKVFRDMERWIHERV